MSEMYKRINSLCKEKGTNVTAMCKALNVARSSLSELNRGRTKSLSYDYISKIANYFNVNPDYIAGKTEQKEKPAQNVQVRDENDNIVVLDKETRDLIDSLRSKPERKKIL
jgi:transcriptional regulator with XRE-family HTH domain